MQVLRYGATASWPFQGHNVDPADPVQTAFLTIKDTWADDAQQEGPEPPLLQLAVTPPSNPDGAFSQDADGNWAALFNFTVEETTEDLGPPPRYLWYEVTLVAATHLYRPIVGQIRMLPSVYTQAES